jgi:dihydroorotate dehydrogenase
VAVKGEELCSGLRGLQSKQELAVLIKRVRAAMQAATPPHDPKINAPEIPSPPLLVKIAPDLSPEERQDIATVAMARGTRVDGLIVSNTTITRPHVMHGEHWAKEAGGLSGAPLMGPSTEMLADMYRFSTLLSQLLFVKRLLFERQLLP